jgi:sporulation integral membrane protein YtvI
MASFSRKNLLTILFICLLLWASIRFLLPVALPFLLAGITALAAEPCVRVFQRRLKLPRPAAAGVGVIITLGVLVLILMVLGALLVRQLQVLASKMPDLGQSANQGLESLHLWLSDIADHAPPSIRDMAQRSVDGLFSDGNVLLGQATSLVTSLASGMVSRLPQSAFGVGTWLLASFMFSSKLQAIRQWVQAHTPEQWYNTYRPALQRMKDSVFGWLKAQLKLMSVTFCILTLGFLLLRVEEPLLRATVIALVDALPVFGTGLIMIPWGIIHLVQGDTVLGVGLLSTYAAAALSRSILEPKFVGRQLGLDPLVTLAAIYTGYRLWGIPGLLFAPLLTVTAVQFLSLHKEM